jgi:hypothetical protein
LIFSPVPTLHTLPRLKDRLEIFQILTRQLLMPT